MRSNTDKSSFVLKAILLSSLISLLIGCSKGHGFEGTYELKAGSSIELLDVFSGLAGGQIVIGRDYLETQGERSNYERIFVRESGDERYLVFTDQQGEQAWRILPDNNLEYRRGLFSYQLQRVAE